MVYSCSLGISIISRFPVESWLKHFFSDNGGIQDMTTLQIELKGQCEEFKVMLQPYAMYIPGHILIETPVKRTFRVY